jgi:uncharacterized protein (TIGR01777 family)
MNILITGSSGLIGTALKKSLAAAGHSVFPLIRKNLPGEPFYWSPAEKIIHLDDSIKIDAVINLAGVNIADKRWNQQRKMQILNSRENATQLLSNALAHLTDKPKVLISGSAIGFYGDSDDESVDEDSPAGSGFLSEVAIRWEQATQPAEQAGIRTVHIRTGVVLSPNGGILKQMMLPFLLGLGGMVGNGRQYLSCVSINELTQMMQFILDNESISGAVNLVSRKPVRNFEFTRALGKTLHRPTIFPLPAAVARIMFGEMADALLLSSTRVYPSRLETAGYQFIDDDLEKTLKSLLGER